MSDSSPTSPAPTATPKPADGGGVWVLAGLGLAIWWFSTLPTKTDPAPQPSPSVTTARIVQVTSKVFPAEREGRKQLCLAVAELILNKTIKTEEELIKFLADRSKVVRDSANADFYAQLDKDIPTVFEGKEEQLANYWKAMAGAW